METDIPPGSTIGLLGGGQLGRMFGIAARRMGYRVHTFEPSPDSPAGQISDREFNGSYTDWDLLETFVRSVDVVTFEFENIPAEVVDRISRSRPVHPRSEVLHICQNREREKNFLRRHHYPHAPFAVVSNQAEFDSALDSIGPITVLKSADFGYDGKGQQKCVLLTKKQQSFTLPACGSWVMVNAGANGYYRTGYSSDAIRAMSQEVENDLTPAERIVLLSDSWASVRVGEQQIGDYLALAEGLAFAERIGLDPTAFLEVARGSASYSQVMDTKGQKMVRRDFSPEGRVRQTLKDAHLMLDQATAVGQKLAMLEVHCDVLEACVRAGESDMDNSIIIEEVRRRRTKV